MPSDYLQFFDSFSREKQRFIPLNPGRVGLYTCGPTVYDYSHIGNMRAYVFADTLRRVLEYNGLIVRHVMNITDVGHLTSDADEGEDKVELHARETGKSAWEVAEFFTGVFKKDIALLDIEQPHVFCKATDHVPEQIELIRKLEALGYTYRTSDGIYFNTSKSSSYGKLANLKPGSLKPGIRVKLNLEKRNQTDFALWKFSPSGSKRQMEWRSPWGVGFPGWHIECSAMAMKYLGETIDIHTGGIDHIPVHHTNEIAQSEAVTGKQFVRYWLHGAFLRVEGQKMSKSLGNIFTLQDLIKKGYDPLAFRYLLLTAHYRSEMNFRWKTLEGAQSTLENLRSIVAAWPSEEDADISLLTEFRRLINNDLDTPRALALLWEVVRSKKSLAEKKAALLEFDKVFGLELSKAQSDRTTIGEIPANVRVLIEEREKFRIGKNWAEADRIRQKIIALGYSVEDTSHGSRLKRSRGER